jgi:linoleoyl-CoA desaturase
MFPIFHLKLIFNQVKAKTQVRFVNKDKNLFFPTLKKRVDAYFKDRNLSKNANNVLILKTIILTAVYVLPFGALLWFQPSLGSSLVLWFIMGIGSGGVRDECHARCLPWGLLLRTNQINYWVGGIYSQYAGRLNFQLELAAQRHAPHVHQRGSFRRRYQ